MTPPRHATQKELTAVLAGHIFVRIDCDLKVDAPEPSCIHRPPSKMRYEQLLQKYKEKHEARTRTPTINDKVSAIAVPASLLCGHADHHSCMPCLVLKRPLLLLLCCIISFQ